MNNRDKQLSKSLSWLLRHGAEKEGLELSEEGYVDINKVLAHKSFKQFSTVDIERVVQNNDKQRFRLRLNPFTQTVEIKANQGHSILKITDIDLTRILEPSYDTVVHGTYRRCWPQIEQSGLSRMRRRHVHLAKGLDAAGGLRRDAQIHVFINLKKALEDGIKFYESANGVILTPGNAKGFLEPKYFDRVIDVATGYPPYTKPQDLAHAFCKFGSVRLNREWITETEARLEFDEPAHAQAAVRASRAVCLYGAFLAVRPARAPRPAPRPRAAPAAVPPAAVPPAAVPLQGDFPQQLDALLAAVRLSRPEIERLAALYRDIELALAELWPGCRAIPFGSVTTGLGVKGSDADCFVALPRGGGGGGGGAEVARARRALAQHPRVFGELLAIPRANTPIVKFRHLPTGVHCDLSFKTPLGVRNSELVSFLLLSDPRLIPLAVVVKYWARVHELTGTGKLTNYALTMLLVFYLQCAAPPLLPPVARLQAEPADEQLVDGWNTGFARDPRRLPPAASAASVADLLGGFFEFYSRFDFDRLVVCPHLGRPIPKDDFRDPDLLPDEFDRYKTNVASGATMPLRFTTSMCVQDPFEQCHNVASPVSARLLGELRAYLAHAAAACARAAPARAGLLRALLLDKPALPRGRGKAQFRARLPRGIVANVTAPDWKTVVRNVTFQVFGTILRVELKKLDGDGDGDPAEAPGGRAEAPGATKKEREKYEGEIGRAIWKRKQFSKLYSVMGLKFLDRETMITDEILKIDKNVIDVRFQVSLTFTEAPRAAVVALKHVDGELNFFKEFGKFFNSIFQHWFVVLYRPYCKKDGDKNPAPEGSAKPGEAVTDEEAAVKELKEVMKSDIDDDKSDSDSETDSYEDERINPDARAAPESDEEETRNDGVKVQNDMDKNDKNKTNSAVKKQSESDKTKKHDTNEQDENKDPTPVDKEKSPKLSETTPQKSKNKTQRGDKTTQKNKTKSPRHKKSGNPARSAAGGETTSAQNGQPSLPCTT